MHQKILALIIASLVGPLAMSANAAIVTSTAGFDNPSVVDFSQFDGPFLFTVGPVQVGAIVGEDITWSSTTAISVIGNVGGGDTYYGLDPNGNWTPGRNGYVGLNATFESMRFDFNDGPVAQVAAFVNYVPSTQYYEGPFIIEALGASDNVLEVFDVTALAPISTPSATDAGAFRGFSHASNDIYSIRLIGALAVADDLTFARVDGAVPEPASLIVWSVLGIAGIVGYSRRRKAA